jgi:hypothetical protein
MKYGMVIDEEQVCMLSSKGNTNLWLPHRALEELLMRQSSPFFGEKGACERQKEACFLLGGELLFACILMLPMVCPPQ